jgi:hypothetical protein
VKENPEGLISYNGDWDHDLRSGWGTLSYADGRTYEGSWANDEQEGPGSMRYVCVFCV